MSFLYGNNRTPRTVRRAEYYKATVRRSLAGFALSVLLYIGLAVYFTVYLNEKEITILLGVAVFIEIIGTVPLLKFYKQALIRYYSHCTDDTLKLVLILPQTRKLTRFTCAQVHMYFLAQDEESAIRHARTTAFSLQKGIPKEAKKRAVRECKAFLKQGGVKVYGNFSPVDLYELHHKKIICCQSVLDFYGEPNRAVLSQNGCEFTVAEQ